MAYILQNGGGQKTFSLFIDLAAESHHNLHKVWSTRKLNELPSFRTITFFVTFLLIVQEHIKCDVRRLRDIGGLRKGHIVKTGEGLR